jgi:hypothetical protein
MQWINLKVTNRGISAWSMFNNLPSTWVIKCHRDPGYSETLFALMDVLNSLSERKPVEHGMIWNGSPDKPRVAYLAGPAVQAITAVQSHSLNCGLTAAAILPQGLTLKAQT